MSDDRLRDPSASIGSPRLTALALVVAAAATAGIALHPGLALADGPGAAGQPPAARAADGGRLTVVPFADDDQVAEDPDADPSADDPEAAAEDDGATLGDDPAADGTDDLGDEAEDDDDPADDPITAVIIDRRGRTVAGPRAFAASRAAKGSKLRWTGWDAATSVGKGKISIRGTGRAHRRLKGAGTITLSSLTTCDDGTPVYRRAVFAVGRKGSVTVKLPGCSALD